MPPSQLKQLKASLRDHGVLGPQKSKKQRRDNAKDGQKRLQRQAALENIRERFNPFEVKAPARRDKFEIASNKTTTKPAGRPGVTRGLGEERRRDTLLKEIQSRNKIGGVLDRRFGENDPTMTPEQRAAERFARQNERRMKKTSMFNLEEQSEEEMLLTHGGRTLDFNQDDYQDKDSASEDNREERPSKRIRLDEEDAEELGEEIPQRKKSKHEVMQEVIAKSKLYKAERQAAKADDDEIRKELDKGMAEFYEALRGHKPPEKRLPTPPSESEPIMNPARAAMLAGKPREEAEKEYEANLRQLKLDARSKPTFPTKTEEEKAGEAAARLEELERQRVRRMKGEESSDEEDVLPGANEEDFEQDDAEAFGLAQPEVSTPRKELDVEDEDDFVLDDIIASDSEADMASDGSNESDIDIEDDGDDDFINGLVLPTIAETAPSKPRRDLAYTYPCPQTHDEFLEVLKDTKAIELPTIVQRIRALYHKGLATDNQEKLGNFAAVLTEHIAYLADTDPEVSFAVLENLLRHLHSMAKGQPAAVGSAFRAHLSRISETRPLQLSTGDLIVLTGISTIFPTSDNFHSVVTPAMLTLGRYLGQSSVQSLQDLGIGAYACTLALQYQKLSKRYVPEVITYIVNAIHILSPTPLTRNSKEPLNISLRQPETSLRITKPNPTTDKLSFKDLSSSSTINPLTLLHTFIQLAQHSGELWFNKTAFPELIQPLITTLTQLQTQTKSLLPASTLTLTRTTLTSLTTLRTTSTATRKPLLLHTHRPLAIKTSIPAFIENYNPARHYDPDRERAELSKLKAEHKKERKGAMRELRKDANFIAREQLREKKAKDEAYEKKFKRLVAEIQGEEGREGKEYEKEKRRRKGARF